MKQYYIAKDGEQLGPYSIEKLQKLNLDSSTLMWCKGMDEWKEAKEIEEISNIVSDIPPPIPQKSKKEVHIEAEIRKSKDYLLSPQKTAKEIKANYNFIKYSLLIGIISFPLFFAFQNGFKHLKQIDIWEKLTTEKHDWYVDSGLNEEHIAEINKVVYDSRVLGVSISAYNENFILPKYWFNSISEEAISEHKIDIEDIALKSLLYALYTLIGISLVLILYRYISKAVGWVNSNSID